MGGFVSIEVQAHAGYKADETPRAFLWQGRRVVIEEVMDRWYQASRDPRAPSADYFKVRAEGGEVFILRRDNESMAWYLQVQDAAG